jgi:hypothetical protein
MTKPKHVRSMRARHRFRPGHSHERERRGEKRRGPIERLCGLCRTKAGSRADPPAGCRRDGRAKLHCSSGAALILTLNSVRTGVAEDDSAPVRGVGFTAISQPKIPSGLARRARFWRSRPDGPLPSVPATAARHNYHGTLGIGFVLIERLRFSTRHPSLDVAATFA